MPTALLFFLFLQQLSLIQNRAVGCKLILIIKQIQFQIKHYYCFILRYFQIMDQDFTQYQTLIQAKSAQYQTLQNNLFNQLKLLISHRNSPSQLHSLLAPYKAFFIQQQQEIQQLLKSFSTLIQQSIFQYFQIDNQENESAQKKLQEKIKIKEMQIDSLNSKLMKAEIKIRNRQQDYKKLQQQLKHFKNNYMQLQQKVNFLITVQQQKKKGSQVPVQKQILQEQKKSMQLQIINQEDDEVKSEQSSIHNLANKQLLIKQSLQEYSQWSCEKKSQILDSNFSKYSNISCNNNINKQIDQSKQFDKSVLQEIYRKCIDRSHQIFKSKEKNQENSLYQESSSQIKIFTKPIDKIKDIIKNLKLNHKTKEQEERISKIQGNKKQQNVVSTKKICHPKPAQIFGKNINTLNLKQFQSKYEGQKLNNKKNGRGILQYNDGIIYQGQFYKDNRHGYGILKFKTNKQIYNGQWKNDCFHGQGKVYNLSRCNMKTQFSNWVIYSGQFRSNKFNGMGTLLLYNGQRFLGRFQNGMANGQGTFYRVNGDVQYGYWQQNEFIKHL